MRSLVLSLSLGLLAHAAASPATDAFKAGQYAAAYEASLKEGDKLGASQAALAQGMYRQGNQNVWFGHAERLARQAVKDTPKSARAHYLLASAVGQQANTAGNLLRALDLAKETEREFKQALALEPNYPAAAIALARWHSAAYARAGRISGGNPETARTLSTQTVQKNPQDLFVLIMAGYVAADLGDKTQSQQLLERGLAQTPHTAWDRDVQAQAKVFLSGLK